jgi:hypothetical protein
MIIIKEREEHLCNLIFWYIVPPPASIGLFCVEKNILNKGAGPPWHAAEYLTILARNTMYSWVRLKFEPS